MLSYNDSKVSSVSTIGNGLSFARIARTDLRGATCKFDARDASDFLMIADCRKTKRERDRWTFTRLPRLHRRPVLTRVDGDEHAVFMNPFEGRKAIKRCEFSRFLGNVSLKRPARGIMADKFTRCGNTRLFDTVLSRRYAEPTINHALVASD